MKTKAFGRKYGMIETLIECRKVSCEKIAKLLSRFMGKTGKRNAEFKVWLQDGNVRTYFKVASVAELNMFRKALKTRKIDFTFRSIRRVVLHGKH